MVVKAYEMLPPANTSWHILASALMMSRCSHRLSAWIQGKGKGKGREAPCGVNVRLWREQAAALAAAGAVPMAAPVRRRTPGPRTWVHTMPPGRTARCSASKKGCAGGHEHTHTRVRQSKVPTRKQRLIVARCLLHVLAVPVRTAPA